ncbi:uncharacterized protein LOC116140675 isoform X2 [Pistacia vera]|uniref:uncharacterized protein LOC116140675 isoform X2 n=1 Tax=Pistacia vera TaxID=55513 RepID=UPI001263E4EE|nr:uncharacterized protein LOC116140675 isoform X2 [Pistacia vera]
MASRYRAASKPLHALLKSTINKPTIKPKSSPFLPSTTSSSTFSRSVPQLGCVQSLLPLHTAVSTARLTSCLGIDSRGSRSLSQELGLSVPR